MLAARNGHKDVVLKLYYYEALVSSFWTYPGYYKILLCILNY